VTSPTANPHTRTEGSGVERHDPTTSKTELAEPTGVKHVGVPRH